MTIPGAKADGKCSFASRKHEILSAVHVVGKFDMAGDTDWSGWAQMGVALLALVYAIRESRHAREERRSERRLAAEDLRLRARPELWGSYDIDFASRNVSFVLRNVGLGPARLTRFRHVVDDVEVESLSYDVVERARQSAGVTSFASTGFYESLREGTVIGAGEAIQVFGWKDFVAPDDFNVKEFAWRFCANVEYESIYGEKFSF